MSKMLKLTAGLAGAAMSLSLMSGTAHAAADPGAYGFASLEVSGLAFTNSDGSPLTLADFASLPVAFNSANVSADLNGASTGSALGPIGLGLPIDLAPACLGAACGGVVNNDPAQNFFFPTQAARGDQNLTGNALFGTASALTVAEVRVNPSSPASFGQADSDINSINGFQFALAGDRQIRLSFFASLILSATLGELPGTTSGSATAQSTWEISLTGGGLDFTFTPDGIINNTFATTGGVWEEEADDVDLTQSRGAIFPGQENDFSDSGDFSILANLVGGVNYTVTISHDTDVDARAVPEPSTLALVGLGLLSGGIAWSRRRRKQAA